MVYVLNPNTNEYVKSTTATLPAATTTKPAAQNIEQMMREIASTIRDFLVNPEQCTSANWASDRFVVCNRMQYYETMARGFQDWALDIYDFKSWNGLVLQSDVIYETYLIAINNAVKLFGEYALEQQAIYIAGALFTKVRPVKMVG